MGRVNMKKKAIAIVLSILMVAGNTGTVPVFAAETTQEDAAIDVTSVSSEDEQRVYEEGQTVENPSSQIEDEQPVPEEEQTVENPSSQNIDEQEAESLPVEEEQNESDEEETVADAEETVEEAGEADTDSETAAVIEPVTESVTAEKGGMSDKGVVKSGECGENARYTMTGSVDHITVTISGSGELYGCSEDNHPWSDYKNGIETVVIEEGITGIGGYMFYGCVNLRSVTMADSVTMIRQNAFKECTKLSTVKLPEGLIEIQDRAFQFCRSLTSIKIPEGVTLIGYAAFDGCSGLCSIELPDSLTRITGYSFCECSSLTSLEIPKSIIKIDEYAFTRCSSLTSFVIPEGVTSIGRGAFKNCSSLTDIEIPEEVTEIGYQAFYGCSSLAAIDLPEGMTEIGYETFSGCSSLTGIEIPEGVTSIGKYAFCNCSSLSGIEIPEGVQGINEATFYGCISLTGVEIPEGVTSIGKKAFYECSSLEEIIFPRSLKNIESNAFYSCNNLKELVFPEGLQSIGSNAFGDCQKLNTITVPGSATNIDGSAFKNDTEITAWYTVPGSYLTDHYPEYGAVYYLNDENAGKYCHIGFITDSIAVMSGDSFNLDEYIVTNLNLNECTVTLSDESNFIYDDGMIASISAGACNITVSNGETSATARIVAQDKPIGTAEKIAFNDSAITIARGQYSSNTLNITPGNSGIEGFEWYSSDETVVTVNRGILYAIGEGTATVTVMNPDHNEVSAECTVTVSVPLNDLIVIDPSIKIEKGKARQVLLYKYPSDNTDEISYTSSDDSIASVDQFGKVTGVGFGTAVITASAGKISKEIEVAVYRPLAGISLDKTSAQLGAGESLQLNVFFEPGDATETDVAWNSSKDSVATVDENGLVTAHAKGIAIITVTSGSYTAVCTIICVEGTPVTSVSLDKNEITLHQGTEVRLLASVLPKDASDKNIRWESSDESVAGVGSDGTVTAVGPGDAVITAKAVSGDAFAQCLVHVVKGAGIIVRSPADVKASKGERVELTVEAEGENLVYQWQWSIDGISWRNCTSAGYNTDTFGFAMKASVSGRRYRCAVSKGNETEYSDDALITLDTIRIIEDVEDVTASVAERVVLHVKAEGEGLAYQWQWSDDGAVWKNCTSSGYDTDTFTFSMKASVAGRQYRCIISKGTQKILSGAALISLRAIRITRDPEDAEAHAGEQVIFSVKAEGTNLSYQWQWSTNGITWKNCTSGSCRSDVFSFAMKETVSGRRYRCIVRGDGQTLTSKAGIVTLVRDAEIVRQPSDVEAAVGETVEFSIEVNGEEPVYQWQWSSDGETWKDCTSEGCNTDTFSFKMKASVSGRRYRCIVTCGEMTLTSDAGVITLK